MILQNIKYIIIKINKINFEIGNASHIPFKPIIFGSKYKVDGNTIKYQYMQLMMKLVFLKLIDNRYKIFVQFQKICM